MKEWRDMAQGFRKLLITTPRDWATFLSFISPCTSSQPLHSSKNSLISRGGWGGGRWVVLHRLSPRRRCSTAPAAHTFLPWDTCIWLLAQCQNIQGSSHTLEWAIVGQFVIKKIYITPQSKIIQSKTNILNTLFHNGQHHTIFVSEIWTKSHFSPSSQDGTLLCRSYTMRYRLSLSDWVSE